MNLTVVTTPDEYEYKPFYRIDIKNDAQKVTIEHLKLVKLLRELGYRRMDVGEKSFIIKVSENILELISETQLIDQFEKYLNNWPDYLPDGVDTEKILNKLYAGLGTFFAEKLLYRLGIEEDLNIQSHTRECAYFYFNNGFVEVTKDGIVLRPYSELKGKIWKNQILPRDFKVVSDFEQSNFAKFVSNISNNWEKRFHDGAGNPDKSPLRYRQFKQILGYLLHSYTKGKMRAIIMTDSRTDDVAAGRTGKTLIMKALGEAMNAHDHAKTFVEVNGKDFDSKDRFKWQELSIETRLAHLNDVQIHFDITDLFNDVTEGVKCQKKNEMPFIVPTKLVLSTNRTVRIEGDSAQDRIVEFEMADYYGANNGPDREFNEWFFRDWNAKSWNQFDNFICHCTQVYLMHGLQRPATINLEVRKMKEETSPEFVDYMEDNWRRLTEGEDNIQHVRNSFEKVHPDYKDQKWFSQRIFNKWVKKYAQYHPLLEDVEVRKSNGLQFMKFKPLPNVKWQEEKSEEFPF